MNMIARGEIIACEILLDVSEIIENKNHFNEELKRLADKIGVQLIIEAENVFEPVKKLLILDLNENLTIIQNLREYIKDLPLNEISKGLLHELRKFSNQKDYKNRFVEYLKDLDIETIKSIINTIKISPGTEEMIRALKLMNYKIALISNSLNFFVDMLKERLNLDYAFSTTLEVKNGLCTGQFINSLEINAKKKSNLVNWLASMEKIPDAEIHEYGIDEKEPMLSHSAGLKISIDFDYKKITDFIKNKKIKTEQVLALFILIGLEETQINNLISIV
jgi:phosphoserine phosphatase